MLLRIKEYSLSHRSNKWISVSRVKGECIERFLGLLRQRGNYHFEVAFGLQNFAPPSAVHFPRRSTPLGSVAVSKPLGGLAPTADLVAVMVSVQDGW